MINPFKIFKRKQDDKDDKYKDIFEKANITRTNKDIQGDMIGKSGGDITPLTPYYQSLNLNKQSFNVSSANNITIKNGELYIDNSKVSNFSSSPNKNIYITLNGNCNKIDAVNVEEINCQDVGSIDATNCDITCIKITGKVSQVNGDIIYK